MKNLLLLSVVLLIASCSNETSNLESIEPVSIDSVNVEVDSNVIDSTVVDSTVVDSITEVK